MPFYGYGSFPLMSLHLLPLKSSLSDDRLLKLPGNLTIIPMLYHIVSQYDLALSYLSIPYVIKGLMGHPKNKLVLRKYSSLWILLKIFYQRDKHIFTNLKLFQYNDVLKTEPAWIYVKEPQKRQESEENAQNQSCRVQALQENCCFSFGGNLNFPEYLQKKIYNINYSSLVYLLDVKFVHISFTLRFVFSLLLLLTCALSSRYKTQIPEEDR